MEDLEWLECVCVRYPFLILCVVKCTINKQQRGSSMAHHTPPPLHIPPHVFCRLRGPDMELIHSAGSRSDITLCVCVGRGVRGHGGMRAIAALLA